MNEDTLNMEIRRFLKNVGITSQREIERAVVAAVEDGRLAGNERIDVSVRLNIPSLGVERMIDGTIGLE
jgi:ribosomal protein L1